MNCGITQFVCLHAWALFTHVNVFGWVHSYNYSWAPILSVMRASAHTLTSTWRCELWSFRWRSFSRAPKCVRDGVVRSESDSAEWWCCRRTFCIFIYQFAGYAHHKHIKSKLFTFMDGGWGAATVGACNLLSRKHFYFYYLKMQRICARSELAEVTHTHTMRSTYTIYAILIIY